MRDAISHEPVVESIDTLVLGKLDQIIELLQQRPQGVQGNGSLRKLSAIESKIVVAPKNTTLVVECSPQFKEDLIKDSIAERRHIEVATYDGRRGLKMFDLFVMVNENLAEDALILLRADDATHRYTQLQRTPASSTQKEGV
jgi:hypothetical protein